MNLNEFATSEIYNVGFIRTRGDVLGAIIGSVVINFYSSWPKFTDEDIFGNENSGVLEKTFNNMFRTSCGVVIGVATSRIILEYSWLLPVVGIGWYTIHHYYVRAYSSPKDQKDNTLNVYNNNIYKQC
jgi:uncharacterized membrane protein YccC